MLFPFFQIINFSVDFFQPKVYLSSSPKYIAKWGEVNCIVDYPLKVGDRTYPVTYVSMGNPHVIIFDRDFYDLDISAEGTLIGENRIHFPQKTNVQFVRVINEKEINLRTRERGAGVTTACGTGACASVVASVLKNKTGRDVTVHMLGGNLNIKWSNKDGHVYMTGPAETICKGKYLLEK